MDLFLAGWSTNDWIIFCLAIVALACAIGYSVGYSMGFGAATGICLDLTGKTDANTAPQGFTLHE